MNRIVGFLAAVLFLEPLEADAQKEKILFPGVPEADYYYCNGAYYSKMVKVSFADDVINLPLGTRTGTKEAVVPTKAAAASVFSLIETRWGKFSIEKVFPSRQWGDTLSYSDRLGAVIRVPELSQHFRLIFDSEVPIDSVSKELRKIPEVRFVGPPGIAVNFTGPNDPIYMAGGQWNLSKILAPAAWDITQGSSSVTIGIVDQGRLGHEDLSGKIVGGDGLSGNDNHGEAVAGTVAALTNNGLGIASLGLNLSLLTYFATAYPEAIEAAGDAGAEVINMSWGWTRAAEDYDMEGTCNPAGFSIPYDDYQLASAIEYVQDLGVICIAAAGNHSVNWDFYKEFGGKLESACDPISVPYLCWPANYPNVIGVSATDSLDRFFDYDEWGGFNFGSFVTLSAPGIAIWHPYGTPSGYAIHNGTSFSAPEISALVGLILSISPNLSVSQITDILTTTAEKVDAGRYPYSNGYNVHLGYGRVNAYLALKYTVEHFSTSIGGEDVTVAFPDDVTIAAGKTLTVLPGTTINFAPGKSLTVNGTLAAIGTSSQRITFDRSGSSGTWGGIVINSGGSANIQYCDISNAWIGIDLEGSALASIEHCNLSGDNCYGIKAANATASNWAIIRNNTISSDIPIYCYYGQVLSGQNTLLSACQGVFAYGGSATVHSNLIDSYIEGIFALNYSTVSLLGATDGRGHNRILPTDATLYAEYNSSIDAGEPAGGTPGYNSFYGGCIDAQMVAVDDGHILAQYNWWNDDFSSITFNGGTADNSNPLGSDPNGGMGKVVAQAVAKTTTSGPVTDPFFDADLVAALNNMHQGKYDNARELLSKKFTGAISVGMKKYILAQLGECYKRGGRSDFLEFFNADVRPNLAKTDDLYVASLELESKWYIQSGLYDRARALLQGMRSEYSTREETYKHVLFNLGNLCYSQLNEIDAAREYLEELKAKYPKDVLSWHAGALLGERGIALPKPGSGKTPPGQDVPESFAFSQNYPNPFNPSTTLKYALPAAGEVSLVVLDVLGREVAILVNGNQEAGYYSVTWNATKAASGIYFARFMVKSQLGAVKFNKVNKLLFVK